MTEIEMLQSRIQKLENTLAILIRSERYTISKTMQFEEARNIQVGKTVGTKFGTETTQKMGWWGKTPVIQQTTSSQTPATFVANTSAIADDTATWDGYTIGDIVAILRVYGLIA